MRNADAESDWELGIEKPECECVVCAGVRLNVGPRRSRSSCDCGRYGRGSRGVQRGVVCVRQVSCSGALSLRTCMHLRVNLCVCARICMYR